MAPIETKYAHIQLDKHGVPIISRTNMKVIELVVEHIAHGSSPEELQFQHPYLSLGQIHSALAYYSDHEKELNAEIERQLHEVDQLRGDLGETPLVARLRSKDLL
jgi:uncharacterized protein (DUF433 family)